jgi:hypothetical protein
MNDVVVGGRRRKEERKRREKSGIDFQLFPRCVGGLVMETTHGKTHSENGEGECWWSRIASPYPDATTFFISLLSS